MTLTDLIYMNIKDKDQAHEVDQEIRNKLTPYLMDKPETIKALYEDEAEILIDDAIERQYHSHGNRGVAGR